MKNQESPCHGSTFDLTCSKACDRPHVFPSFLTVLLLPGCLVIGCHTKIFVVLVMDHGERFQSTILTCSINKMQYIFISIHFIIISVFLFPFSQEPCHSLPHRGLCYACDGPWRMILVCHLDLINERTFHHHHHHHPLFFSITLPSLLSLPKKLILKKRSNKPMALS